MQTTTPNPVAEFMDPLREMTLDSNSDSYYKISIGVPTKTCNFY
jgi:hypothetical protein